jgi:glycosyltransferase 2 family protein
MIGAHHSQQRSRAWLVVTLRWVAALAVLGLLLHFLPLAPLRTAIARVPASRFVAILAAYLIAHSLGIAKWRMVVNAAGADLDFATCAQCYAGGLFGTLFLPSIIGGDMIRLAVGLRRSPRPSAVLAGNIADRFLDVAAQGGLALLGLILLPNSVPVRLEGPVQHALLASAAACVLLVGGLILLRHRLLGGRSIRFRRKLGRLRFALRSVSRRHRVLIFGWVIGTVVQTVLLVLTAQIGIYCGLALSLRIWLFAWPLAKLAAILPLTQGGIGVREAALVALLAPFGAPGPLVFATGLVWEGVIIAGGLIAGAIALALRRGAGHFPLSTSTHT